jgi:hypothetical protein
MKVQILVEGASPQHPDCQHPDDSGKPSKRDVIRIALKAALDDEAIKPSEALRATFRLFDVMASR